MACLDYKSDHLIPGRMMQNTVIRIQHDHDNEIYQHGFRRNTPEETGIQHPGLPGEQESDKETEEHAETVQKYEIDMLGPAAHFRLYMISPSFLYSVVCPLYYIHIAVQQKLIRADSFSAV